jgi:hypothetical protein
MQPDWLQVFLYPLIIGIVLLLIEYLGFQGWLRKKETRVQNLSDDDSQNSNRTWSNGLKKAIEQFKKVPNPYKWKWHAIKPNFITISQMTIRKGQAELTIGITERFAFDFFGKPKDIAKYKMVIDRVGDIYSLDLMPRKNNAFDSSLLPFPFSWVLIALILIGGTYSQLTKTPEGDDIIDGKLVSSLWINAPQIFINSSVNGSLGNNEIDAYVFKSETGEVVQIAVKPVDYYRCYLSVYNTNNSLIRRTAILSHESINLAPELNANYLIVIDPYYESGGSYTLSIATSIATPSP